MKVCAHVVLVCEPAKAEVGNPRPNLEAKQGNLGKAQWGNDELKVEAHTVRHAVLRFEFEDRLCILARGCRS